MRKRKTIEKVVSLLQKKVSHSPINKPIFFDLRQASDVTKVYGLINEGHILFVVDELKSQRGELTIVKKPNLLKKVQVESFTSETGEKHVRCGKWVYYPWKQTLVHIFGKSSFSRLRISRNYNLITKREQKEFVKVRVGVAGLNVGNPAAICLALEGVENMKFADNDVLTLSNLNRFRAGISELGLNKAILSARQVYEINPFAKIKVFSQGVQQGHTRRFLLNPKVDILVEETDNLKLKIEIREEARKNRIPVVMVTGNSDSVIIDVERFDITPKLPLLNGYLKKGVKNAINSNKFSKFSFKERVFLARDFIGTRYLKKRLRTSFLQVGTSIAGIPQLAESSFLRGAAVCYAIRQISTKQRFPSGRYRLELDKVLKNKF